MIGLVPCLGALFLNISTNIARMWAVLTNVPHWPDWDVDLKESYLNDPTLAPAEGEACRSLWVLTRWPTIMHDRCTGSSEDEGRYIVTCTRIHWPESSSASLSTALPKPYPFSTLEWTRVRLQARPTRSEWVYLLYYRSTGSVTWNSQPKWSSSQSQLVPIYYRCKCRMVLGL